MYQYAATYSMFDDVLNIYMLGIATAFLAIIIAFYWSNIFKDESQKHLQHKLIDTDEEDGEDENQVLVEQDNSSNNSTTEFENNHLKQELKNRLKLDELEINSGYEYKRKSSTSENSDADYDTDDGIHVDGLVSKLKSNRVKELEAQLTRDQLEEEKRIEREQLAAIFELLKKQEAELNMKEIDESELNAQLALYR